jgi:serine/threonine-protein kinase
MLAPDTGTTMRCQTCHCENPGPARGCAACGAPLVSGGVLAGRYQLGAPIGRGGMSIVHRGIDCRRGQPVAVKLLRPEWAHGAEMERRFGSELVTAQEVDHVNVCRILNVGEDAGVRYIVMELVEGCDLKRALRERGAFPPALAFEVALELASGVQAIHEAGLVHRDIKSPNVVCSDAGPRKIMDFDLAIHNLSHAADAGVVTGTPEYMSPEQARGERVDFRTDIYALAIVIYEVFTGRVPFHGATSVATVIQHLREPPPLDDPRLPPALLPILAKALAKQPQERQGSARGLGMALRLARSTSDLQQPE